MAQLKQGNSVLITGTLPRDAEFTRTKNDIPLTKFGVKADEIGDERVAVWYNCVCWRDLALITAALRKGDYVLCSGKIQTRSYTDKYGEEKTVQDLVCDFTVIQRKAHVSADPSAFEQPQFEVVEEDELPF